MVWKYGASNFLDQKQYFVGGLSEVIIVGKIKMPVGCTSDRDSILVYIL